MILFSDETTKDSVIAANSADVNYPVANVLDSRLTKVYRTDANTTAEIVLNAGAAVTVSGIAIANHNISSGATIKIQGNATESWSSPSVDESITFASGIIKHTFTEASYQYWRIQIVDAGNSDGYIEIGRSWVGKVFTTPGISKTVSDSRKSNSAKSISVSGQSYQDVRYFNSMISVKIPRLTHAEKASLITEFENVDYGVPFFVQFDESCLDLDTLYVTMDMDQVAFNLLSNNKYYESAISFMEEV